MGPVCNHACGMYPTCLPLGGLNKLKEVCVQMRAVHTPGHASDHLCFWLEEEEALFTGDHILGTGTVIVDDLDAYMSSLQKLNELRPERIYPGHGPMLEGVAAKQRPGEYMHHRQLRLKKAVELLESSQNSS